MTSREIVVHVSFRELPELKEFLCDAADRIDQLTDALDDLTAAIVHTRSAPPTAIHDQLERLQRQAEQARELLPAERPDPGHAPRRHRR